MASGDYAFGTMVLSDGVNYFVYTDSSNPAFNNAPAEVMRLALARREGSISALNRFTEGHAMVAGIVFSAIGLADLESKWDALARNLENGVQNLKLGWQDERYWLAQIEGSINYRRAGPTLIFYSAPFIAVDPFAYAATASQDAPGATVMVLG